MKVMKAISMCIFLLMLFHTATITALAGGEGPGQDTLGIRVLCYNIHHANPPSHPDSIDLNAIAEVIKQQQPDLVALQEVDVYTTRSGQSLHQAKELGRITGMEVYFAKAIDYGGGEYGVAILSKYPMTEMKKYSLPTAAGTGGEPRILATAIIKLPQGREILFANTHLDAQGNDTNRILQAQRIVEILSKEKLPVILAGDLNAVASTRVIGAFDNHFMRSCITNCGFTIPVINPNKTIDYIVYAPKEKFKVIQHKVIPESYASDHRPVMAILQLQ